MHYGPRHGVVGKLSEYLEDSPLRSRSGTGGYASPDHATVDVLLRLCREAYHHTHLYRPALATHDVVVLDHGMYSKLAYALTVLTEQHPDRAEPELLGQIRACVAPWFVHPDRAFFLDVPWPLARERAILRGRGGGNPGSVERLLFLPRYTAAYRQVIAAHPQRVCRIHVGACGVESVLAEIEDHLRVLLHTSLGAVSLPRDRTRDGLPLRAVTPSRPIWRVDAVARTPELVSGSSHGRRAGAAARGDGHRRRHDHGLSRSAGRVAGSWKR